MLLYITEVYKEPGQSIWPLLGQLWFPKLEALRESPRPPADSSKPTAGAGASRRQQAALGRPTDASHFLLVPGGWNGPHETSHVMMIIERTGAAAYSLVVCNTGPGLSYHPSDASQPPKMRYKTCIRLNDIPRVRMMDSAFWTLMFTLWMKGPAHELHRVEML